MINDGAGVSGVNRVPNPLETEHVHHGGDNSIVHNSVDPGIEDFDETKNISPMLSTKMGMNMDYTVLHAGAGVSGVSKVSIPMDTENVQQLEILGGDNFVLSTIQLIRDSRLC